MNNTILSIKDLCIVCEDTLLVNKLNIDIEQGDIFALVGESGSGKSLTAMSILQLLPQNLSYYGDILYQGKNLNKQNISTIRGSAISIIFQDSDGAINPVFTIGYQLLETVLKHKKIKKSQGIKKVYQWLESVHLGDEVYHKYSHELSGGQKQRVMIAISLVAGAKLIIADEPTTALDVSTQKQILLLLLELKQKYNLSILLITHDLALVKEFANKVAVMRLGSLLTCTKVNTFFHKSSHNNPYIQDLLQALPASRDKNIATNVYKKTLLSVENIHLSFPIRSGLFRRITSHYSALSDINIKLLLRENLAIVGESGSGKTSLAKLIVSGLSPDCGQIKFNKQNINTIDRKNYATQIQIVFQNVMSSFNPRQSILNTLFEGMLALNVANANTHTISKLFSEVELNPDLMHKLPHQLSGGQLQRAALVRALCVQPKVIICDEPTSALDNSLKKQILDLLLNLQQKHGLSFIIITHDMSVVRYFADKVIVLKSGKIVESGQVDSVLTQPKNAYTKLLLDSVF